MSEPLGLIYPTNQRVLYIPLLYNLKKDGLFLIVTTYWTTNYQQLLIGIIDLEALW